MSNRLSLTVRTQLDSYGCSCKMVALKLLLEKALRIGDFASELALQEAEKVVVFSQKPQMLELIESQLLSRYDGLQYVVLRSTMTSEQRMGVVEAFQQNPKIALLLATTGISGHGYTLTTAHTVIFTDHNFNPFVDLQAIDRCHRIGQTQTVQVYRLVSDETNESRLMKWGSGEGVKNSLKRFREHVATTVIKTEKREEKRSILCELEASSKRVNQEVSSKRVNQEVSSKRSKQETSSKRVKQEASSKRSKQETSSKKVKQETPAILSTRSQKQEPAELPNHDGSDNDSSSGFELYG